MLKKLLVLPLIWGFFWLTAFASATDYNFSLSVGEDYSSYISPSSVVFDSSDISFKSSLDNLSIEWGSMWYVLMYHWNDMSNGLYFWKMYDWSLCYWSYYQSCQNSVSSVSDIPLNIIPWETYYFENSSLVWSFVLTDWQDNNTSSLVPTIPSSFTIWLTSLVSNFGATIVNWLPTIILVALGIYAIFALFRVVRWYSRSSFRW